MREIAATIDSVRYRRVFDVATWPARLVSRYRVELSRAVAADAVTFESPAPRAFFALLVLLAVTYPVAASIAHALVGRPVGNDTLAIALRPFFDVVYAESLPFMIAAVGVGLFSPALGVLFMAVFVPADLIAASKSPVELYSFQRFGAIPPFIGRAVSYVLLWILAVEIPLFGRRWATVLGAGGARGPSVIAGAVGRIGATVLAVFLWARALPWLIQPVFRWIPYQFPPEASAPTWIHWPVLVTAATAIAGVASIWPKPAEMSALPDDSTSQTREAPSTSRVLVRHWVAVVVLAALFSGLMTTVLEAVVLIAGLVLAGPLLTMLLPRVKVPAAVARVPMTVRWMVAVGISLAVTRAILTLAGEATFESYFVIVLALAIVAPLFRFLMEVGVDARASGQSTESRPESTSRAVLAIVLFVLAFSLVFPSPALADDCPGLGELKACLRQAIDASLALIAFATLVAWSVTSWQREPFQGAFRREWQGKLNRTFDAITQGRKEREESGLPPHGQNKRRK
jgi:hypothetical protein